MENKDIKSFIMGKVLKSEKPSYQREESHVKINNETIKRFECKACDKIFGRKEHLKIHIKTVHDKNKACKCDFCEKSYGHQANLIKHIKAVHDNDRPHKCDSCDKRFVRKSHKVCS